MKKGFIGIGLVGDYNSEVTAHIAIPKALEIAGKSIGSEVVPTWIPTASLADGLTAALTDSDAIWCVPASPYASMEGALRAIRFAREMRRPFLGTCGGFQHAILEFARNVLGHDNADHAETNPSASMRMISPLSCSLVEVSGKIRLNPGSRAESIFRQSETVETYHCNYGLNPQFRELLEDSSLKITGTDDQGDVRIVELDGHPFFIGTLFQPERSALRGLGHPLIDAFMKTACERPV
jgi:CTP synthase (UTP-ammonia lyase)